MSEDTSADEMRFAGVLGADFHLAEYVYGPEARKFRTEVCKFLAWFFEKPETRERMGLVEGAPFPVVELGVGAAWTTEEALGVVPGMVVHGVDDESLMLAHAEARLAEHLNTRCFLYEMDILEHLRRQRSGTYEACFTTHTLHNLTREARREVYAQLHRVLRPGALLIQLDRMAETGKNPCGDPCCGDLWSQDREHKESLAMIRRVTSIFTDHGRHDLVAAWVDHLVTDGFPSRRMVWTETVKDLERAGFKGWSGSSCGMQHVIESYR
ncbi:MAG: class I SAM-dependent methyltransferase [Candidatus Jacksonbacteria bacterium]|jgi:tRNA (cmo5U34)-methyltransferase|nr:class I SAM-dependent methyltransferase [Candidatus Jacksonbacteria bacterium]MBT6300821.1 class I SAM-dependent methyltransferase [Candidatus Jacksonbacteria bacterium]MBT6757092.1 class I SAM-dependent methyltransferase [Candidatus Jacksonbacteria bacterium]MBT6955647.1 class I SAM-dependent methyltransferase [Candidatus Jacksonbacteria bacterium]MBT7008661.1 class I SAM-dependent methyltransferase [Candidatus Jacksonbacteria bacterium]